MNTTTRPQPINSAANDYINTEGARISAPVYCDLTTTQRKLLLNGVREKVMEQEVTTKPATASGISVVTRNAGTTELETYLGLTTDVLRTVIFQRGGIEISLLLRLQEVTGIEVVSQKDIAAAFTARKKQISDYLTSFPFVPSNELGS